MVGLNHAGWKTLVKTQFIFASADCNHELVLLVNKLECTFCFKRILYCIEQFIVDAVRTAAANCETKCSLEGRWLWFFYLLLYHLLLYEILCAVNCSCKRIHQIFRGSLKVFLSSPSAYRVQFRKKKKKNQSDGRVWSRAPWATDQTRAFRLCRYGPRLIQEPSMLHVLEVNRSMEWLFTAFSLRQIIFYLTWNFARLCLMWALYRLMQRKIN